MGWGVHDYPEPPPWYMDDEWPIRDEWEVFYDDAYIDELYEADEDDLL